jgi:hypothetical protein
MGGNPLVVGIVALACTISVAAGVIWLATVAGVPSESAVPVVVVLLLAVRSAVRRSRAFNHQPGHDRSG